MLIYKYIYVHMCFWLRMIIDVRGREIYTYTCLTESDCVEFQSNDNLITIPSVIRRDEYYEINYVGQHRYCIATLNIFGKIVILFRFQEFFD